MSVLRSTESLSMSFNLNLLECKFDLLHANKFHETVLISTYWNVNKDSPVVWGF